MTTKYHEGKDRYVCPNEEPKEDKISKISGLQFPVGIISRQLRNRMKDMNILRISSNSAVYMAATLEYLTAEVLELAGNATRDRRKVTICECDIKSAINTDEELHSMCEKLDVSLDYKPPEESDDEDDDVIEEETKKLPSDFKVKVTIDDKDLE
jgi:histone H2A